MNRSVDFCVFFTIVIIIACLFIINQNYLKLEYRVESLELTPEKEFITKEKILKAINPETIIPCGMIGLEHYYVPSPVWIRVGENKFRIDAICENCGKRITLMIETDNPNRFDFLMRKYYTNEDKK